MTRKLDCLARISNQLLARTILNGGQPRIAARNSNTNSIPRVKRRARNTGVEDALVLGVIPIGLMAIIGEAYLRTDLNDADNTQDSAYPATSTFLQSHHVRTLERDGLVVIPNALDGKTLEAAREDLFRFAGKDVDDGNPNMNLSSNDSDVRQDKIAWVRTQKSNAKKNNDNDHDASVGKNLEHCIRLIRGVTFALLEYDYNQHNHKSSGGNSTDKNETFHYLVPQKCQLACYPGDGTAVYHRHLDRCKSSFWDLGLLEWLRLSDYRARYLTVILYLNQPDRPVRDGGALRCWVAKNEDSEEGVTEFFPPLDVQPTGGTMVIFQSERVEHMVLSSIADRYAITSWVMRLPGQ